MGMLDRTAEGIKGWPSPYAIDFAAPIDSSVTNLSTTIFEGTVCCLTTAGRVKRWTALDAGNPVPEPYFVAPGQAGTLLLPYHKVGDDAASSAGRVFNQGAHGPVVTLLPASVSYELETTEFVAGTYEVNDVLQPTEGTGKVTKGNYYLTDVCGIVTRPPFTNKDNKTVIRFRTFWLPRNPQGVYTYA